MCAYVRVFLWVRMCVCVKRNYAAATEIERIASYHTTPSPIIDFYDLHICPYILVFFNQWKVHQFLQGTTLFHPQIYLFTLTHLYLDTRNNCSCKFTYLLLRNAFVSDNISLYFEYFKEGLKHSWSCSLCLAKRKTSHESLP